MSNACPANNHRRFTSVSAAAKAAPIAPAKVYTTWEGDSATPAPRDCDCHAADCLICEVESLRG
jgi:hypothetical protein